jgi:hypothetical protein
MANSTRNRTQRQPLSEADSESRSATEILNLWHVGSHSECWASNSAAAAGSWGSPFAASARPALRLRRQPRRRTLLHRSRPSQKAAARFTSGRCEYLTD